MGKPFKPPMTLMLPSEMDYSKARNKVAKLENDSKIMISIFDKNI